MSDGRYSNQFDRIADHGGGEQPELRFGSRARIVDVSVDPVLSLLVAVSSMVMMSFARLRTVRLQRATPFLTEIEMGPIRDHYC